MRFLSREYVIALLVLSAVCVASIVVFFITHQEEISVPEPIVPTEEELTTAEEFVTSEVIGTSVQGRAITAFTYGSGETRVLFVGGIHGGYEWNSVLLAYELMDALETKTIALPEGMSVSVIPSLNPDGVFAVVGTSERFTLQEALQAPNDTLGTGRFNAHDVDLNRNFDCKWQPESTWRGTPVSTGAHAFSEPEAQALQRFVLTHTPVATIFFHSQSDAVYASECEDGILPLTREILNVYSYESGYKAVDSFNAYPVTGDAEGWLASIGIPAITVELSSHETVEWERNRPAIQAVIDTLSQQSTR